MVDRHQLINTGHLNPNKWTNIKPLLIRLVFIHRWCGNAGSIDDGATLSTEDGQQVALHLYPQRLLLLRLRLCLRLRLLFAFLWVLRATWRLLSPPRPLFGTRPTFQDSVAQSGILEGFLKRFVKESIIESSRLLNEIAAFTNETIGYDPSECLAATAVDISHQSGAS